VDKNGHIGWGVGGLQDRPYGKTHYGRKVSGFYPAADFGGICVGFSDSIIIY
jgi:hypothetical protein